MSADNYLLIDKNPDGRFPVYHLFASDDGDDARLPAPIHVAETREGALEWAHNWTRENVCEYGYSCSEAVWA